MTSQNQGLLDPQAITAGLGAHVVGAAARSYAQVGSTMDVARAAALAGEPEGLVIVADEQTAGRGRARLPLLRAVLRRLDILLYEVERGKRVQEAWRQRLATLGQRVRVTQGDSVEEGLAVDVGPNGELLLRRDDGGVVTILAGDV